MRDGRPLTVCLRLLLVGAVLAAWSSFAAEGSSARETGDSQTAGRRYDVEAPDTLDLADRARLALNGLTSSVDPQNDYEMYFLTCLAADPPFLLHMDIGDYMCCQSKWIESLPMMRVMSGSEQNVDVENKMMEAISGMIDEEDGLFYLTVDIEEKPWFKRGHYDIADEPIASPAGNARFMLAMMAWYERDRDPAWLEKIQGVADGLTKTAVFKDDYAFYPEGKVGMEFSYLKKSGYKYVEEAASENEGAEGSTLVYQGAQIRALSRWYKMSGDERALETARRLVNFVTKRKMWVADAVSIGIDGPGHGHFRGHFHGRHVTTRGILEYAHAVNDPRLKEFVRDIYEYSRDWGIGRMGIFGDHAHKAYTEGCSIADMVALAIRMSDYGVGDYWDDVDQFVRNQATESQFVRADLLEKASKAVTEYPEAYQQYATDQLLPPAWGPAGFQGVLDRTAPQKPVTDRVIERSLGMFPFFSMPTSISYPVQGGCCSGNLTNALYYAWESITRYKDGVARVNLLLNRASPWLDIDSHLPYEGKVVIKNKRARKMTVRIPRWVDKRAVECAINQTETDMFWVGNTLVFDGLQEKDVVTIEFPMVEQTVKYTHPFDKEYTITFKGNTVVDISPRETNPTAYPIYLRDHYKRDKAPMKKVTHYVSPVVLNW